MITRYDHGINVSIRDYKADQKNKGKVAVFDFPDSRLIAEGQSGDDWMELEKLCEELRKNGDYRIVIVPEKAPTIKAFRRILA